jgi:hypothetical protein
MHGIYSYIPKQTMLLGYSYYPCYHTITIIIIIIITVTMGITQFDALNIPRQCPLHLHQQ